MMILISEICNDFLSLWNVAEGQQTITYAGIYEAKTTPMGYFLNIYNKNLDGP